MNNNERVTSLQAWRARSASVGSEWGVRIATAQEAKLRASEGDNMQVTLHALQSCYEDLLSRINLAKRLQRDENIEVIARFLLVKKALKRLDPLGKRVRP